MKEDLEQATESTRNSAKEDEERNKQLHKMVAPSLQLVNELGTLMKVVAKWIRNWLSLKGRRKTKRGLTKLFIRNTSNRQKNFKVMLHKSAMFTFLHLSPRECQV